jgi:hypothetical protein
MVTIDDPPVAFRACVGEYEVEITFTEGLLTIAHDMDNATA